MKKAILRFVQCFCLLLSFNVLALTSKEVDTKIEEAKTLLKSDVIKAELLCNEILQNSKEIDHIEGTVKANYYLGYLKKQQGDFGKAIIYYLEGIRHAEKAQYVGAQKDLIGLLKNSGTIFLKFQNYDLASKYYNQAIEVASKSDNVNEYARVIYANARLLGSQNNNMEAIASLESLFGTFNQLSSNTIALIYNELGLLYSKEKQVKKSEEAFGKLIDFVSPKSEFSYYTTWAYHNLGNLYFEAGEFNKASEYFQKALDQKVLMGEDTASIFLTMKDLGESLLKSGEVDKAEAHLIQATALYDKSKNVPEHYQLYKLLGEVAKLRNNIQSYGQYQELYSKNLESYLEERKTVEETDKKYNLELITQRYFAMVAEQERNKQIMLYSTVGITSLIMALLTVVSIFYYRRWKLRRDLEKALKPLTNQPL